MNADTNEWKTLSREILAACKRGERATQWANALLLAHVVQRVSPAGTLAHNTASRILALHEADKRARPWPSVLALAKLPIPDAIDTDTVEI